MKDVATVGDETGFIHTATEIAQYHHENWDGSGYPTGRKGDSIPLSAQIVGVVGAYCALTEERSYRSKAYTQEEAIAIMEGEVGRKFNPDIFFILKKIIRQLQ